MVVVLLVLTGFCSLGVDWGRVQLVKTELQRAADAAARYAASGLAVSVAEAEARAVDAANDNTADGASPVELTVTADSATTDVQFGTWDAQARSFTPLSGSARSGANAIRVWCRRTAERGNAVPLLFARVLGRERFDVTAVTTVLVAPRHTYGIVGLDGIDFDSNALTDSYNSSVRPYASSWSPDVGTIASNGDIRLLSNSTVRGDARHGAGRSTTGGTVTGTRAALAAPLNYPAASSGPYGPSNNSNGNLPSGNVSGGSYSQSDGTVNMPSGNYYFENFTMDSNAVLNVTGPATVYVAGAVRIDSDARTSSHRPQNLQIIVLGSGSVDLIGNYGVWADVYAPGSAVLLDSNKHLYGRVVARTLRVLSNGQIHYDESLAGMPIVGAGIQIVQ